MKKLALTLAFVGAVLSAFAQRVAEADVASVWKETLSSKQVASVEKFVRHMDASDKWHVYSAVVRSKEFHKDYFPGEPMTEMKVLSAVRTRLSTDDSSKFNALWSGLDRSDRNRLLAILRDIQTG
jgi:formaldehyde-activating enzyme involved in methanogenesis